MVLEAYSYLISLTSTSVINSYNFYFFFKGKIGETVSFCLMRCLEENVYSEVFCFWKIICAFAGVVFLMDSDNLEPVVWHELNVPPWTCSPCSSRPSASLHCHWPSLPPCFWFQRLDLYLALLPFNLLSNSIMLVKNSF